jgi:hypothetical protein
MPTFDFAPLVWWGLPLAAAPVLIHLINLLRQRRVKWAAMEFLLASQRKYRTRVMLRQLLLLSLRTAAVLGLVLALAGPRWRAAAGGLLGTATTAHLVLLDDSCSMGDRTGGERMEPVPEAAAGDTRPATAFDRGRRVVERIAADLAAGSGSQQLTVGLSSQFAVAAGDRGGLRLALPRQPVSPATVQAVRDALGDTAESAGSAGPREAIAAVARELSGESAGGSAEPRVLWMVGDFRSRDWLGSAEPAATLRQLAADGVTLRFVDCAADSPPAGNLTIERLEVIGGVPAAGVLLPVEVEVRNDGGGPARDVLVELREDGAGRPGVRIDEVPAGGVASGRFDVRFAAAGSHTLEAGLPADTLPADNVRRAVVDVVDRVEVLIIDGAAAGPTSGDGFYVATALAPGVGAATGLRPRVEPPAALATADLRRFDCLWLLDIERLDPAAVTAVEAYVRGGGGVVFFCGPKTRAELINGMLHRGGEGLFPVPLAGAVDLLPAVVVGTPVPDVVVEDHPVVAVLAGQRNPLLSAVRIDRFWAVERGHDPAASGVRRLLSLRTGQPLAVEKPYGDGLVVAVLTTAAPTWNNWARGNPSWVVVMLELESHLARLRRRAETLTVGDPVTVRLKQGVDEGDVDFLVPPDGDLVRQTASRAASGVPAAAAIQAPAPAPQPLEARLPAAVVPGLYEARWRRLDGTERQRSIAVNVDPAEGRLDRAGRERLDRSLSGVRFRYERAEEVAADGGGIAGASLAVPLLLAVAGLLLVEQLVACAAGYHPVAPRSSAA